MEEITDYKLLLDTAVLAGEIMIKSGAEIYRVEDTINHILKMSHLKRTEAFVTTTGMFATLDDPGIDAITVVRRIAERDMNLFRIWRVNDLSRQFCEGRITLKEIFRELKHIEQSTYTPFVKDLGTILVAAGFVPLMGGQTVFDILGGGICGLLLVLIQHFGKFIGFNSFIQDVFGSALIAVGAMLMSRIPVLDVNMDVTIISAIMPLVPGAAITTAIRDTLQGDYMAGGAKAIEAFIKAVAIVVGVALGMLLMGGISL
ncbi:threonine/serine exporter family protein [Murimonas intestini]|uniref:Uncharacterized membrane protein YjjP (DUF1212 family) n=1 Tax=Murimonas intestini TaxID=1337051 RepID=A0AB73T7M8_9FIRM|nr:threonine/serine exporter family protein [Murimonas intestini]MCR1839647.1 threonine/serine exporter family protein [Murimonas intestini]MCR1866490.1 threonine/serine exporter family protein [Murimonas intestini]MCR1884886.1 threonine/serine exporter family protein [Murimonas intestini]